MTRSSLLHRSLLHRLRPTNRFRGIGVRLQSITNLVDAGLISVPFWRQNEPHKSDHGCFLFLRPSHRGETQSTLDCIGWLACSARKLRYHPEPRRNACMVQAPLAPSIFWSSRKSASSFPPLTARCWSGDHAIVGDMQPKNNHCFSTKSPQC
jgi:hypothetical protein